jgi:hypothetical protein
VQPIRGAVPDDEGEGRAGATPPPAPRPDAVTSAHTPAPGGRFEAPGYERRPQLRSMVVAAAMGLVLAATAVFVGCGVQSNPTVQVPNLPGVPTLPGGGVLPSGFPSLPAFPTLPPGFSLPPGFTLPPGFSLPPGFPELPSLPG